MILSEDNVALLGSLQEDLEILGKEVLCVDLYEDAPISPHKSVHTTTTDPQSLQQRRKGRREYKTNVAIKRRKKQRWRRFHGRMGMRRKILKRKRESRHLPKTPQGLRRRRKQFTSQ